MRPAGTTPRRGTRLSSYAAIETWRGRGAEAQDSRRSSTNAILSNIFDPDGNRMELLQLPPESEHAQATARWSE